MTTSSTRWQARLAALVTVASAFTAALYGCPGSLDAPDRFRMPVCDPDASMCDAGTSTAVTTEMVQTAIFTPKCAFASCHGAMMTQAMLDLSLSPSALRARVVNAPSARSSTTTFCGGRVLVRPGEPERSLMFTKLTMTATLCGARMPQGPELSAAEKAMIRQWIMSLGAQ